MKKDDLRKYLGKNGDKLKVVGIIQHLGRVGDFQTICLASIKVMKDNGEIVNCDHCWVQNHTKQLYQPQNVGQVACLEVEVEEYCKYNRSYGKKVNRKGLRMIRIIKKNKRHCQAL